MAGKSTSNMEFDDFPNSTSIELGDFLLKFGSEGKLHEFRVTSLDLPQQKLRTSGCQIVFRDPVLAGSEL